MIFKKGSFRNSINLQDCSPLMLNNKLKIIKLSLRNYSQVMLSLAFCFKSGWNSLPKTPYFLSLFYSLFIVTLLSLLHLFQAQTKPKK